MKGDFHGINKSDNKIIASEGKHGFHISVDNRTSWKSFPYQKLLVRKIKIFSESIAGTKYMEKLTLEKLTLDIHTGKAFFGEGAMWIWIDLIAISLLFMTLRVFGCGINELMEKRKTQKKDKFCSLLKTNDRELFSNLYYWQITDTISEAINSCLL